MGKVFLKEKTVELGMPKVGLKQVNDVQMQCTSTSLIPLMCCITCSPYYLASVIIQLLFVLLPGTSLINVVQLHIKVN